MTALSNRVHLFAHPSTREELDRVLTNLLGLAPAISLNAPGLDLPILIYQFANGASVSVQFGRTHLAPRRPGEAPGSSSSQMKRR